MPAARAFDVVETIRSLPLELRRDYFALSRSGQQRVSRRSAAALRPLEASARAAQAPVIFADALATYRANVEHEAARHGKPSPLTSPPAMLEPTPAASPAPPSDPPARYYLPCTCGAYLPTNSPRARFVRCTHEAA